MIAVIADDLSGATELGAMGFRHGLSAEICLENAADGSAGLICLDTDSRSCSADVAGLRVKAAAKSLRQAGAKWIYKKTDSVLRGRVVVEIEALMEELGMRRAFLLPANPSLGRVLRGGKYFVHGKAVHETEFARDPEYPRTSANVIDMLGAARQPVHVCSVKDSLPASGIIVCEAETSADLSAWSEKFDSQTLTAGAAEFFETIVRSKYRGSSGAFQNEPHIRGAELFVCGSTSESSRAFIASEKDAGTPAFSLPAELAQGGNVNVARMETAAGIVTTALRQSGRAILNIGFPLISDAASARMLLFHLARFARMVIESGEVGHVYAEGGATAVALMRNMGWRRLTVVRELAQGVVTTRTQDNEAMYFTVKPGTYIWPDSVRRVRM